MVCFAVLVAVNIWSVESRIGTGAVPLTSATFQSYVSDNEKVLVDFYRPDSLTSDTKMTAELNEALRVLRSEGCKVPLARVNVAHEVDLAQRYVPQDVFPQLVWFLHGEPTSYHRSLHTAESIANFVFILNRRSILTAESETDLLDTYNRGIIMQTAKGSPLYKAVEVVAGKFLDRFAVMLLQGPGERLTWHETQKATTTYNGDHTVESVERWVRRQLTRSEEPPSNPAEPGDAVVVVGQTFADLVMNANMDVFLMVYAPWCGYSRRFYPIWDELKLAVSHLAHLRVAQMDGDRNDSPYPEVVSWNAFPTVFFFRAGTSKPWVFHGNRTVPELLKFAQTHSSKPMEFDSIDLEAISEL